LQAQAASLGFDQDPLGYAYSAANGFPGQIDILVAPEIEMVWPEILEFDTAQDWASSHEFALKMPDSVHVLVVDSITWCGGAGAYGSCSAQGGNFITISSAANGVWGERLLAQQLGYSLGLETDNSAGNLMNAYGHDNGDLSPAQVATILASPLIKTDAQGAYVDLRQYRIIAARNPVPVPLPAGGPLLALLLGLGAVLRRHIH